MTLTPTLSQGEREPEQAVSQALIVQVTPMGLCTPWGFTCEQAYSPDLARLSQAGISMPRAARRRRS